MQCNWYSRRKKKQYFRWLFIQWPATTIEGAIGTDVPFVTQCPNASSGAYTHTIRWYARCTTSTSKGSKKRKRGASILNKSFQIAQYIIAKSARAGALILCASQDDSRCQNPSAVLRARALARVMHSRTNGTEQEELNQTTKNILPFKTLCMTKGPQCCPHAAQTLARHNEAQPCHYSLNYRRKAHQKKQRSRHPKPQHINECRFEAARP